MKTYIERLIWVAAAQAGDAVGQPAFALDVIFEADTMQDVTANGGMALRPVQMNVAMAIEAGLTLEVVGATINGATAAALEAAQAAAAESAAQIEALQEQLTQLQAQLAAATAPTSE